MFIEKDYIRPVKYCYQLMIMKRQYCQYIKYSAENVWGNCVDPDRINPKTHKRTSMHPANIRLKSTVKPRSLEHRWLAYHG